MKESIIIRNVGPLKEVYIEDVKPMTVLIGESASGKSTLMKVIILMRYIYKMLNIRCYLKNAGVSKSPFRLKIDNLLSDDLVVYIKDNPDAFINYTATIHGHQYEIEVSKGKLITKSAANIPNEDLYFLKESWISESRSVIPMWASKAAANKKAELGFYFHETLADFDKATEAVRNLRLGFVGMDLQVVGQNGKRKYFVVPEDNSYDRIELKYASSGIQTSTPLATLVHYFAHEFSFKDAGRRSILDYLYEQDRLSSYRPEMEIMDLKKVVHIHVEEPELSLFPDAQCKLVDEMALEAFQQKEVDRSLGLMLATHSPYIINYLNVMLHQNKANRAKITGEQLGVFRIFDGRLQNLMVQNQMGKWLVNTKDLTEQMKSILVEYQSLSKQPRE